MSEYNEYQEYKLKMVEDKWRYYGLLEKLDEASINDRKEAKKRVEKKSREEKQLAKKQLKELNKRLEEDPLYDTIYTSNLPRITVMVEGEILQKHIRDNKKWIRLMALGVSGDIISSALFLYVAAWGEVAGPLAEVTDSIIAVISLVISISLIALSAVNFVRSAIILNKNKMISNNRVRINKDDYYELQQVYDDFLGDNKGKVEFALTLCVLSIVPVVLLRWKADVRPELECYGGYAVCAMLAILGVASYTLIKYVFMKECYEQILYGTIMYRRYETKKELQIIYGFAPVLWGLAALAFLTWGMVFHSWQSCWIAFMFFGVVYSTLAGTYNILAKDVG